VVTFLPKFSTLLLTLSRLSLSLREIVEHPTKRFVLLLVLADFAFFAVHLLYAPDGLFDDERFRLDWDRGYAETFQYVKEFWIVFLLLYLALRSRALIYLVFAGFFAYLGLDDSVRLHERIGGGILGTRLGDLNLFGRTLEGWDLGQMFYAVGVGLGALFLIMVLYHRSRPEIQHVARNMLLLLVTLAYFGVFTDILNAFIRGDALDPFFVFMEEGGEHLVMTTILGYLFILVEGNRAHRSSHADAP